MIGLGRGGFFDFLVGANSWDNPGVPVSPPREIQAFVKAKGNPGVGAEQFETLNSEDFFYNKSMLPILRNWELTKTILKTYGSTLKEILQNSKPTITGCGNIDSDINEFIEKIGLTQNICDNLEDDLYYGQRAFLVDYREKRIFDLKNSRDIIVIKRCGKLYKYAENIDCITDKGLDKTKIYASSRIGYIGFNLKKIAARCTGKYIEDQLFKDKIEDITYYQGQCVISSAMYIIFEHMLKSLLRLMLTLKNTTRPDIMQVQVGKEKTNESNIAETVSNIESILNAGEYSFDLRSSNIMNIIQTLYNTVVNSVKVVPTIANINSIDQISLPAIGDKIDKLNQEVNDCKTNALLNTAIPEELIGTGSNKWEIIARSTRYNTTMNDLINQIGFTYKLVASNYLKARNIPKNFSEIELNIDTSSYLTSSNFSGRTSVLLEKLSRLKEITSVCNELEESKGVNKERMRKYVRDNLDATEKDLSSLLNTDEEMKKLKDEDDKLD